MITDDPAPMVVEQEGREETQKEEREHTVVSAMKELQRGVEECYLLVGNALWRMEEIRWEVDALHKRLQAASAAPSSSESDSWCVGELD